MDITVYGSDVDVAELEYQTVGELVDALQAREYIVTQIVADEIDITNFPEEEVEGMKPINSLELGVRKKKELVAESLDDAEDYLPRLISGIDGLVTDFSQANETRGYEQLGDLLEGLEWLNSLLKSLKPTFNIEFSELETINGEETIKNWQNKIKELLTALENQDLVLLSDLLEYELIPILESYLQVIKEVKDKIEIKS